MIPSDSAGGSGDQRPFARKCLRALDIFGFHGSVHGPRLCRLGVRYLRQNLPDRWRRAIADWLRDRYKSAMVHQVRYFLATVSVQAG
jgi:hypothetical protein